MIRHGLGARRGGVHDGEKPAPQWGHVGENGWGVAGHVKVRNSKQGRRPSPPCPCLGPSLFLAEFGLSFPVAVAFNHDNLGVVGEAIDQRDRAGGVGKDGVPVLERQVRRHEQGAVFIAAADDLD